MKNLERFIQERFEPAHKLGILLLSNFAGPAPFLSKASQKIRSPEDPFVT